jgi:anti-anti-sigma regulatory factor
LIVQTRIDATKWQDQHWIRLVGPATFTAAPTLLEFVDRVLKDGACEISLDLAACCWMDSTFAGTLVSLSKKGNRDRPLRLRLHNPSKSCLDGLARMNLDKLFSIDAVGAPDRADWEAVEGGDVPKAELAEVVIRAHEDLGSADPGNEQFSRIADAMRKDIQPSSG